MTKAPFAGRLNWVAPGSKIALAGTAAIGATSPLERAPANDSCPPFSEVRPDYAELAAWPMRRCLPSIWPCRINRRSALCVKNAPHVRCRGECPFSYNANGAAYTDRYNA
jgi:hypothetical protein